MAPPVNRSARPALTANRLKNLMETSAGRRPASLLITGARLVNVMNGRIEENVSIALAGDRIAAVGPDLTPLCGPRTMILPAGDRLALPGMIDAHTHLDAPFSVRAFARLALLSGHTAAATETAMAAGAWGRAGVEAFIREASGIPFRVFFLVPALVPPFPTAETSAGLPFGDFAALLRRPDVLGIGEIYWRSVLELEPDVLKRMALARSLNKTIEGHSAGARGLRLQAYRAGGVRSCHESVTAGEVREKLALGYAVQIREGDIRSELPAMAAVAAAPGLDTRRLMLVTDVATPEMTMTTGIMTELVRRAVAAGFDPMTAVQMVTINPADHFGLADLGRIAPGALADIVLADELSALDVRTVLVGGRVVAENGVLLADIPDHEYPEAACRAIALERVADSDFRLAAPDGPVRVRAVVVAGETITREEIVTAASVAGDVKADPDRDLVKLAVFDRRQKHPVGAVGLLKGLGLRRGAVATSLNWDNNNIIVAGVSETEMALAANRVLALGGGFVAAERDRVRAEWPLPVFGTTRARRLCPGRGTDAGRGGRDPGPGIPPRPALSHFSDHRLHRTPLSPSDRSRASGRAPGDDGGHYRAVTGAGPGPWRREDDHERDLDGGSGPAGRARHGRGQYDRLHGRPLRRRGRGRFSCTRVCARRPGNGTAAPAQHGGGDPRDFACRGQRLRPSSGHGHGALSAGKGRGPGDPVCPDSPGARGGDL